MEKTDTLNQISLTGEIPLAVTLPKAPVSVNADVMTDEELHAKLQKAYEDIETGNVQSASVVLKNLRSSILDQGVFVFHILDSASDWETRLK